jgi:hypothetical protein
MLHAKEKACMELFFSAVLKKQLCFLCVGPVASRLLGEVDAQCN